ncbi:hypothetical protein [Deinococcus altitudinis]|uniref:hypothetical protein n=1 Tax=Deinococcus altitudinis TaxID=468914 RepID=UPI003891F28B
MGSNDFSISRETRRLIIVNLGMLFLLMPFSNVIETFLGSNVPNFALVSIATIGNSEAIKGSPVVYKGSVSNHCIQKFKYDLNNIHFDGFYKIYGNAYYYGCRPGIDIKYQVDQRVNIYIDVHDFEHTEFSRWGFQSWFFLQQIVYCLIVLVIFISWFVSTLERPLPWWLQPDHNSSKER